MANWYQYTDYSQYIIYESLAIINPLYATHQISLMEKLIVLNTATIFWIYDEKPAIVIAWSRLKQEYNYYDQFFPSLVRTHYFLFVNKVTTDWHWLPCKTTEISYALKLVNRKNVMLSQEKIMHNIKIH